MIPELSFTITNIVPNILEIKVLKGMNIAEKFYNAREYFGRDVKPW